MILIRPLLSLAEHTLTEHHALQRFTFTVSTKHHSRNHKLLRLSSWKLRTFHTTTPKQKDSHNNDNDYDDFVNDWMTQSNLSNVSSKNKSKHDHSMFEEQLLELQHERESLFGFTEDERTSWSRNAVIHKEPSTDDTKITTQRGHLPEEDSNVSSAFTHVSPGGDSVTMVDIGPKIPTRRNAKARSSVVFPPEVMDAFTAVGNNDELVGPKGPIFATAKIAGIMAAKRTAELIPLCHPLPLDKVDINIHLVGNKAIVECECTVTHKTGVEMEALTGASIAALTVYDMVKAVSHEVQIEQTVLVSKSGGKRTVG